MRQEKKMLALKVSQLASREDESSSSSSMSSSSSSWKFRPLNEFLESGRFGWPETSSKLEDRLTVNLLYYRANYFAIFLLFMLYACVAQPFFVFGLLIVVVLYFLYNSIDQPLVVGDITLSKQQQLMLFLAAAVLVLVFSGGRTALFATALSTLIIIIHSILRKRSIRARSKAQFDEFKKAIGQAIHSYEDSDDD